MLKIILEFRKGILFVRLKGVLDKRTLNRFNKNVTSKISDNGISTVVLNFESLKSLDLKGINSLFYIYELCKRNKGKIYICNMREDVYRSLKNIRFLNYVEIIDDELEALKMIKI